MTKTTPKVIKIIRRRVKGRHPGATLRPNPRLHQSATCDFLLLLFKEKHHLPLASSHPRFQTLTKFFIHYLAPHCPPLTCAVSILTYNPVFSAPLHFSTHLKSHHFKFCQFCFFQDIAENWETSLNIYPAPVLGRSRQVNDGGCYMRFGVEEFESQLMDRWYREVC